MTKKERTNKNHNDIMTKTTKWIVRSIIKRITKLLITTIMKNTMNEL